MELTLSALVKNTFYYYYYTML
uniref:Uncharacterized protein n=1 Tax=Anguilla anguilla TaxID=7936 RepID=A0A0E9VBG3_ANGAN